jgi:hypothetical protein
MQIHMKKIPILAAAVLSLAVGFSAHAQFGKPGNPTPDSIISKIFGTNLNFSADMQVDIQMPSQDNDLNVAGRIYFRGGDSRTEVDMTKITGSKMPPHAADQMKAMGMDKMISISKRKTKTVYMIYPGLESYTQVTVPKSAANTNDMQVTTTEIGKETVDNHPCVKNKYTVTDAGQDITLYAWLATDLKNYPVKIEIHSTHGGADKNAPTVITVNFTGLNTASPDASLFEPPLGYHVYTDAQAMVQTEMVKKMAGSGHGAMPADHPAVPPSHP